MPKIRKLEKIDTSVLDSLTYTWHTDEDGSYFAFDELVEVSEDEALAYYEAAKELYKMYEAGAEYVIKNNLFSELNIEPNMFEMIKKSWKEERDLHIYSRFDLSGGIDNEPIKLIEFNADTPTLFFETAIAQVLMLKEEDEQFNDIYEKIKQKIEKIIKKDKNLVSKFLFGSVKIQEEITTVKLLQKIAEDAGAISNFEYLEDTVFEDGTITDTKQMQYDFWFKLFPWEDISLDEKDILNYLKSISTCRILNPAYTLLYQSKGMLKILYDLFPDSPYLLKTSFEPLEEKYVKKRCFGREGWNIDIVEDEKVLLSTGGEYEHFKPIYQEFADFVQDESKRYYQAGVFFADEPCGLSFRRGAVILDDMSEFIGHVLIPNNTKP